MSDDVIVDVSLSEEDLARIDVIAEEKGMTREEVLMGVVRIGLTACEREAGEIRMLGKLAVKVLDRLFLVAHGTEAPGDEEWRRCLALIEQHGVERTMMLVYTEGGWPSAAQRRALDALLAGRVPIAVISRSTLVRIRVAALSWMRGSRIKVFPESGLLSALAYLEVPASRAQLVTREAARLRGAVRRRRGSDG